MTNKSKGVVPALWNMQQEFITPFSQIFDNFVEQNFPEFKHEGTLMFTKGSYPKVDVIDYSHGVSIHAEIAGWKKEDIELSVENGVLTVTGKSNGDTPEYPEPVGEFRYLVKEIKRSSFSRSFKLGPKLDPTKIGASYNNGTLIIAIQKKEPEQIDNSKRVINIGNID